jgi:hypothetical protein
MAFMGGDVTGTSAVEPELPAGRRRDVEASVPALRFLALALILGLAACGGGTATTTTRPSAVGEVAGRVLAGPVCPVEISPPDPGCADRPVPGAVIVAGLPDGSAVASVTSDAEGRFSLSLPSGAYLLTPQPVAGLLGTASPVEVFVGPDATVHLDFVYDTGIRAPEGA